MGRRSHTLVEPGVSSTAELIVDQIKLLGLEVSSISRLVLMHAHADHITGAPILKKMMPGLKVMAGSETQRLLAKEKIQRIFAREDREISNRLLKLEAIDKHAPVAAPLEGIVDEIINPGHVLRLDGLSLEVLDAPGHCLGGIALWEPEEGILFCSDYLGFFLPPDRFVPNFYVNLDDYMATFEYLSRLGPVCVCPGHCGAYSGEESLRFIAQGRSEVEWVCKFVRGHCETPARLEQVAEELFRRYYVREATMFSAESTRYCMELIIRRILNSNAFALDKD